MTGQFDGLEHRINRPNSAEWVSAQSHDGIVFTATKEILISPGDAPKPALYSIPCANGIRDPQKSPWTDFEQDGLYGYKDAAERVVTASRYETARDFNENGTAVADGFHIDKQGTMLFKDLLVDGRPDKFAEGFVRVFNSAGDIMFLDTCKTPAFEAEAYLWPSSFKDGYAVVCA